MYILINNKKIKITTLKKVTEKFKSFKFKLDEIDNGICFINKKIISTYFFCQKVDIIFLDKEYKILKLKPNTRSEKIMISPKNTYYTLILKNNTIDDLKINNTLKIYN